MSGDMQLKQHVEDELTWEPSVDAAAIGVAVKDAIVTLSGHVTTFVEKHAAEEAVLRIHGVRALASELEVNPAVDARRTDEDIARTAASIMTWNPSIPKDCITIRVSGGWITLEGTVDWYFQRMAAEQAVEALMGVKGVSNQVRVIAMPATADVKSQIEAALKRNAEVDARRINVAIQGNKVTLSGKAGSMFEKLAVERAAWRGWGVGSVENNIEVSPVQMMWGAA